MMIVRLSAVIMMLSQPAFARNSEVPHEFQKEHPCPSTGRTWGACPGYVRDHIIPLCAGGDDATWNMQWQTTQAGLEKDAWERQYCQHHHHP